MSTRFTEGPWYVGEMNANFIAVNHRNCSEPGAISMTLARVIARPTWLTEAEANAALIADAPAMYAILQRICVEWAESETGQIDGDVIEQAEALIARHES